MTIEFDIEHRSVVDSMDVNRNYRFSLHIYFVDLFERKSPDQIERQLSDG